MKRQLKKLLHRLSEFNEAQKKKPNYKAKVLIVVLVILAFGVQIYDNYRTEKENETAQTSAAEEAKEDEHTGISEILYENKAHIILFLGLTAALAVVKYRETQKLKESK